MNQSPKKIDRSNQIDHDRHRNTQGNNAQFQPPDISQEIVTAIQVLRDSKDESKKGTLKEYKVRDLVEHTKRFGRDLNKQLETNQIRKFLDAVKRINARLSQVQDGKNVDFSQVQDDVIMLKPQLAYAAGRKSKAEPLYKVMDTAIDSVYSKEDFDRLVQLIESIVAYHKEAGGK